MLVAASIVWPLVLASGVWQRAAGDAGVWTSVVYAATSRICHQRPERSFHTADVKWPVCARCSGLYLGAPMGAILALAGARRRRLPTSGSVTEPSRRQTLRGLVLAGLPTALTVALEWMGVEWVTNVVRAAAAVPLGAMIAFVIVRVAGRPPRAIGYTAEP